MEEVRASIMGHYLQHLMGGKYQELRTDVCAQEEGSGGKSRGKGRSISCRACLKFSAGSCYVM